MARIEEEKFLKIIKYYIPTITLIISFVFIFFIICNNEKDFKLEMEQIKNEYISSQKQIVRNEVEKVYEQVRIENETAEHFLKQDIKNRVNEAYSIMENVYNEYKYTKTKDEIIKIIKDSLRKIRFNNNRGYYYINNMKGEAVLYPPDDNYEGKSYFNIRDKNGLFIVREALNLIKKKKEGFLTFYWHKPDDEINFYKKISYNKYFEPFDIYVGTGEYLEDYEKKVKKVLLRKLQNLTFNINSYVFIVDKKGKYLSHIRDNFTDEKIAKESKKIAKKLFIKAKSSDGFISYESTFSPISLSHKTLKTTYVKYFEHWGWVIAAGFYNEKLNTLLKKKQKELERKNKIYVRNVFIFTVFITFILFLCSLYLSKILRNYFLRYKVKIENEISKNKKKDSLIIQQTKMAAMGEMLENIAHQWKQPLSVISTCASGIKLNNELNIVNKKQEEEALETIMSNTLYLANTINDFRNFFNDKKKKTKFDISKAYEKTLKLVISKIKSNDIQIEENIENIIIENYENELIQVLMNLFNNTVDAFKERKIKNRFISIKAFTKNNSLIIEFMDNAGGIDEKILEKIFDPYFTTKKAMQGTGIGLYMSKQMVEKHMKGTIKVKNSFNENHNGAHFVIKLPLLNLN